MNIPKPSSAGQVCDPSARRGVIMFVVLLIVLMTGLLAAGLNFYMRSQAAGASTDVHLSQAEEAARAGVLFAIAVLTDPNRKGANLSDDPELFHARVVAAGATGRVPGENVEWVFSLMRDNPASHDTPAHGIADESGKLNLNTITEQQLMMLPGMEIDIAHAILDWRDSDSNPREHGAESDYYASLPHPYSPRNGPFESVEELLLVRGVTAQLLYGNDMNRNGLLEPNEDDGNESLPPDDADGTLNPGWAAYLTIYSAEPNLTSDRRARLNINFGSADGIRTQMIERGFSEELADFVREARRSGMRFIHPADLIGARVQRTGGSGRPGRPGSPPSGGGEQGELLSPLRADNPAELALVLDELATRRFPLRAGLVNPAAAREPVLAAIGFTDEEIRNTLDIREGLTDTEKQTFAWLLSSGVLSEQRFRTLARRMCGRGWQFRVDSVGYSRQLGMFHRLEAIIDVSQDQPSVLYSRNLTSLGPAYVLSEPR